jgi:hypothetical protein
VMQTTMFVPDGFRAGMTLSPHDVVFNGIGDAERCRPSLERARAVLAQSTAPVINDPDRVLASGRAEIEARFAGIAGVIVPRTERIARALVTPEELAVRGWTYPLLVRALGYHAGRFFEEVAEAGALADVLAPIPGEDVLLIAVVDTCSSDGFFRKYRVLFIDERIYPVHLAVSPDWKVHYFSAGMDERPEHRAEERAFLDDMPAVLGARVMATLANISRALGLDYGGLDFALDAAGNVVAFEANATMAVYPPVTGEMWAYRRPAYDAVVRAVRESIVQRAGVKLLL